MLFQLLDQVCADIGRIKVDEAMTALTPVVQRNCPDLAGEWSAQIKAQGGPAGPDAGVTGVALFALVSILGAPALTKKMAEKIGDRSVSAGRRCALASVLAYVVQPHDLIPDDAPGGYGYLDDVILLRAGLVQYLNVLPQPELGTEKETVVISFLIRAAPPAVRPLLQQAVSTMSLAVQLMEMLEPGIAEFMLAQIIANPVQMTAPAAPQGFVPRPMPNYQQGFFGRSGAYVEGNNIMFAGGPSLIDGQLFIPG